MYNYLKILLATSFLYIFYLMNYIHLREKEIYLHQANFFGFEFDLLKVLLFFYLSVPFVAFIFYKSFDNIFSMLLSFLMIIGTLPGIAIYSCANDPSEELFLLLFVWLPFFFTLLTSLYTSKENAGRYKGDIIINLYLFKFFGLLGVLIYLYIYIKYINILHFSDLKHIYEQRTIAHSVLTPLDGYLTFFGKNLAAFSLLFVALVSRKKYFLLLPLFIYLVDYALAANKSSIALILFILFYYFIFSKIHLKYYMYRFVVIAILILSIILQLNIFLSSQSSIITGLYDRIFNTSAGLFARYYQYCNEFGFFHGSTGLLGKLFSDKYYEIAATKEIGSYYFFEGVQSNANFIADGYLNFGLVGSFMQVFILWLLFSKKDNYVFKEKILILLPFIFLFSKLLSSTGLQTALLSGQMFMLILLIKFGFQIKKCNRLQKDIN